MTQALAHKRHEAPGIMTVWDVRVGGKTYLATTYPNSDLVTLETEARRLIARGTATKLLPLVRGAIEKATQ